jgi:nucleotide sugar dehydrogenase
LAFDIVVVGLGYVGLPLALEGTFSGLRVAGLDVDESLVGSLSSGTSNIIEIPDADIDRALRSGFVPTSDAAVLGEADVVIIAVPTPLADNTPDLSLVEAATATTGDHLRPGQLVILESTTYPGTTEDIVKPLLEAHSGLTAGVDFLLAFSPERIDPGNPTWNLRNTPKLVAGIDRASTDRAAELYKNICDDVVIVSGTREAEMAKLLENTYRHVNIALVNELAILCNDLGIDIWEVIDAAATKPFGYQAFYPGPGVGGHCIPVDPNYLSYLVRRLGYQFRFVELAQEINDRMPRYVVDLIAELLNERKMSINGSRVLLIGIAYKPDVADLRESPSLEVASLLAKRGAVLTYVDPHVAHRGSGTLSMERIDDAIEAAAGCDLAVILTPHTAFDIPAIVAAAPVVLDTRGIAERTTVNTL